MKIQDGINDVKSSGLSSVRSNNTPVNTSAAQVRKGTTSDTSAVSAEGKKLKDMIDLLNISSNHESSSTDPIKLEHLREQIGRGELPIHLSALAAAILRNDIGEDIST